MWRVGKVHKSKFLHFICLLLCLNFCFNIPFIFLQLMLSYGNRDIIQYSNNFPPPEMKCTAKEKLIYFFATLTIPGSITATIGYWIFLFTEETTPMFIRVWFGLNPHGLTSIFLLIDNIYFSHMTFKFIHFFFPLFYIGLYYGFATIFHYAHDQFDLMCFASNLLFLNYCPAGFIVSQTMKSIHMHMEPSQALHLHLLSSIV